MLKGVPPPALGSFEFYLFSEGIRREKAEKLAFARLVVGMAALSGLISQEQGNLLLYEYGEDLHQFRYNYGYVPISRQLENIRFTKQNEELRLLKKVSDMTVKNTNA